MRFRLDAKSAIVPVTALVLAAGLAVDRQSALVAYLVAWIAVAAVPIGVLGVLMTSYLVRRAWTERLHSVMTAATATLPLTGGLFIPILIGINELYPAANELPSLPAFKALYLAPWFFALRAVIYFVVWCLLASWLRTTWNDSERMTRAASAGPPCTGLGEQRVVVRRDRVPCGVSRVHPDPVTARLLPDPDRSRRRQE